MADPVPTTNPDDLNQDGKVTLWEWLQSIAMKGVAKLYQRETFANKGSDLVARGADQLLVWGERQLEIMEANREPLMLDRLRVAVDFWDNQNYAAAREQIDAVIAQLEANVPPTEPTP